MAAILVIDDEKNVCELIQLALELSGHRVHIAANGKDGLALLRQNSFDLVITDIFMPEQDGYETILQIKRASPHLKIIAISGGGYFEPRNALKMAEHLGAHYGFNKPFDIKEFTKKINFFISQGSG